MLRKALVTAAVLALGASMSTAQDYRVEVGAVAGWTFSDGVSGDAVVGMNGVFDRLDLKDSFSYGLNLGVFVNENVEVGGLFSQQKSKMLVTGTTEVEVGDWTINNYHGYFAYNWGSSADTARPYLMGGLGATQYGKVDFTGPLGQARETGGETQFSTTWGAGVKVYPGESVGIKLGVRWTPTYIKSDEAGWWCDPYWGCYVVGDAQYSNQFEFTGGVSFRF